jgi:two-component system, chemotaxis family, chemotaxis protein CheY
MALKALVVDDSRIMRNIAIRALNRSGLAEFEFFEADDAAGALAAFDSKPIDLALIDWNLPDMTGIEFVRLVRARGNTVHIPLVMVTSEKSRGNIEEALGPAGADAFIRKPLTDEEVEQKMRKPVESVLALKAGPRSRGGWLARIFSPNILPYL